jgi:fructan beta-fructosidase
LPVKLILSLTVTHGYGADWLLLPTRSGRPKVPFTVELDGVVVRHGVIEYSPDDPELAFGVDVPFAAGIRPVLRIDGREVNVPSSENRPGKGTPDQEALRPVVHFTAERGWLNDPAGLIWHEGEWHLFYQHNPYGIQWGNMHWGHAVSRDLIHWEHLPLAIRPVYGPAMRDWAFTGSAVYDRGNSLGLERGPAMVVIYTSTGRGECLMYSHDRGRTWIDDPGNPVLVHGGNNTGTPGEDGFYHDSRDPRVFRHEKNGAGHWVMIVYEQNEMEKKTREGVTLAIYVSDDLRKWRRTQVLQGWYECPELFELPVQRQNGTTSGERKWVLMEAGGAYVIGAFDGEKFEADARSGTSDRVKNPSRPYIEAPEKYAGPRGSVYAGQTWNHVPESDGRRIYIGWLRAKPPANAVFSQVMSVPTELSLKETEEGPRLHFSPVRELEKAQEKKLAEGFKGSVAELIEALRGFEIPACRMTGRVVFGEARGARLRVAGLPITRGAVEGKPLDGVTGDSMEIDVIVDQGIVEWFVQGGRYYGTYAAPAALPLLEGAEVRLENFSVIRLARNPQP